MASNAENIATLQSTVDGEAAGLKTALENIVKLQVLKGRAVSSIVDLENPLEPALTLPLETWLLQTRAAGNALFQTQD